MSPEIWRVVVRRIAAAVARQKPTVCTHRKATILGAIQASAQDTTGVGERGMASEGELGNVGEPMVSLGGIRWRSADHRGKDSRRREEAPASHASPVAENQGNTKKAE